MQKVVYRDASSFTELNDFTRLSVSADDLEYDELMNEQITPDFGRVNLQGYSQLSGLNTSQHTPTSVIAPLATPARSSHKTHTIKNLNSLSAKNSITQPPRPRAVHTPFWSLSPTPGLDPDITASSDPISIPIPTSIPTPVLAPEPTRVASAIDPLFLQALADIQRSRPVDHAEDDLPRKSNLYPTDSLNSREPAIFNDDADWDFVNDELDASFVKSFPSAAKRVGQLLASKPSQTSFDITVNLEKSDEDLKEIDDDFVIPTIEKDSSSRDDNIFPNRRDGFLRGSTAHADSNSLTPHLQETPSKPPRVSRPVQDLSVSLWLRFHNSHIDVDTGAENNIDLTATSPTSFATFVYRNTDTSRAQNLYKKSRQSRSSHNSNPLLKTTIRIKVPVIIDQTLCDA